MDHVFYRDQTMACARQGTGVNGRTCDTDDQM